MKLKGSVPSSFEEFSRRDDLTRKAVHGGWSPDQARAFFPVLSQGDFIPAGPAQDLALQPELIQAKTFTPGRQRAPSMPWPKFANRDDLEAEPQFKPKPRPY